MHTLPKKVFSYFKDEADLTLLFMRVAMLTIGAGICIFASDGYTTLFSSSKFNILWWETSTVGLFMIFLELGILAYITHMFANWYRKTITQKIYLGVVVVCFSLLCYSGMSSYLWNAYSAEYQSVRSSSVQVKTINSKIENIEKQLTDLESRLDEQRERVSDVEAKVQELNDQIAKNSKDKSDRRTRYADCSNSVDCSGAIADLESAGALLKDNLAVMLKEKERAAEKYAQLENRKEQTLAQVTEHHNERDLLTLETGGMDAERQEKVSSVNSIVISVYSALGKPAPEDPFKVAVNFISIIIYPCYILLNLCIGFNSRGNHLAARLKMKNKPKFSWAKKTKTEKIIIPVPANVTAAELEKYVESQQHNSAETHLENHESANDSDVTSETKKEEEKPTVVGVAQHA